MSKNSLMPVVCAIIIHDGRILAARRDCSGNLPLLWEFPGGKIEQDESEQDALHRELMEELKLEVQILKRIEPVTYDDGDPAICLIPFLCIPAQVSAPVPRDHGEIRWVTIDQSKQLTWAPADIPLVKDLDNLISDRL